MQSLRALGQQISNTSGWYLSVHRSKIAEYWSELIVLHDCVKPCPVVPRVLLRHTRAFKWSRSVFSLSITFGILTIADEDDIEATRASTCILVGPGSMLAPPH